MSVQASGKHVSPSKTTESLNTPKKRKHDTQERESSKKKKKPRTEAEEGEPIVSGQTFQKKDKKKKTKSREEDESVAQTNRKARESQDIELPDADAPSLEKDPDAEVQPQTSSTAIDGDHEVSLDGEEALDLLESEDPTCFYSTRLSLYLSIPAISLESSTSSILAMHLAPLLLTYFPPAQGIVLGFSDPVLSARPDSGINLPLVPPRDGRATPQDRIFARTADEFGVCWAWLTVTFLVFRPEKGAELYGWTNVTSEGFVGLVSYNYFQTAVGKNRIPEDWTWNGPTSQQVQRNKRKGRKGRLRDESGPNHSQEDETQEDSTAHLLSSQVPVSDDGGYFADADGAKIRSTLRFRVVDTEVVPAHDKQKWSLQIDGTLLDDEAEQRVLEEERAKFERAQERGRSDPPGDRAEVVMSGALRLSREGSVASRLSGHTPARHRVAY